MNAKRLIVFRRVLRGLNLIVIGVSSFVFIGMFFGGTTALTIYETLLASAMGLGIAGLGLAWKWELTGGTISLVSYCVLVALLPFILIVFLFYLWPIFAILFISLGIMSKKSTVNDTD